MQLWEVFLLFLLRLCWQKMVKLRTTGAITQHKTHLCENAHSYCAEQIEKGPHKTPLTSFVWKTSFSINRCIFQVISLETRNTSCQTPDVSNRPFFLDCLGAAEKQQLNQLLGICVECALEYPNWRKSRGLLCALTS